MKYSLPKLIEVINSKNPNWTEERISWFVDSIKQDGTNYNALTRANRKVISGFSDSKLEAYVGSLLGEPILNNAAKESRKIINDADTYSQRVTHDAQNSAQQIKFEANTSMEQLLDNATSEAEQIRYDASIESKNYLNNLKAAEVVELYEGYLPAEATLMKMPKKLLSDYAKLMMCDIEREMTKQDIVDTIRKNYDGLGKTVIVVPDRSGQIEQINQERTSLELLENAISLRENTISEKELTVSNSERQLEDLIKSEAHKEKQVKRLKLAQRIGYVMAGVTLAAGAVYGEYTGITDLVDFSHLRR
jgi:vacuolar-type H+-ATPase subunit H